jgi:hypothetical protein
MDMTNTPQTTEPRPNEAFLPGRWRRPLTLGLSIGIGLAFARSVVPALWPDLSGPWDTVVRSGVAGIASGMAAALVGWLLLARPGSQ